MHLEKRKAFTMLELIFVITIIGILSAIAIPKFAMNRDNAIIVKAKSTVASVRNAVATERQQRVLGGDFSLITRLSSASGTDVAIFDAFDGNTSNPVLQYPLQSCKTATTDGCWRETATTATGSEYTYNMPLTGSVVFELKNNRFDCKDLSDANCIKLTR